ncbi:MAG: MFS transporter [Acidobacteriota bacterium]
MTPPPDNAPQVVRAARTGLLVLTLINLLNYVDRQVVAALGASLTRPGTGLHLSDTQFGTLASAFMVVYMLMSPLFGKLGDRLNRPRLLACGVAIWSVFTALGGFAWNYLSLFACRAVVGVGEAAYGTISPAILSDYFKKAQRGRILAIFSSAIPIGSALGYMLGGFVDARWGWRYAFFVAGLPGVVLAILVWRLSDPQRGGQDPDFTPRPSTLASEPIWRAYRRLLTCRPYALTVAGYAAYTFALGAMVYWTPLFLERMRGLPKSDATIQFGAMVVITGFAGTFAGGYLGDYLLKHYRQGYLLLSGVATLLSVPFAAIALTSPSKSVFFGAMVVAQLLLFASTGPINSTIVNLVNPLERATASALAIFSIHFLGDVPSPPLIGWMSDRSDLAQAMLIVPFAIALAGLLWLAAAWAGARDDARLASN